jgi:glucose-1-phosphate thymidylyltransferase
MKGVILAGGQGTRLRPLTLVTNKHLLPVYNKPMIYYPLERMADAGIRDVLIVSGKEHAGQFLTLLRSGQEFGLKLSYAVQEESGGIAQALALAEDFSDGEKLLVILGDNIFEASLKKAVQNFMHQEQGAKIFLKEVQSPEHYGVVRFDAGKNIEEIVEKPQGSPPSRYAVIGVYLYDNRVFDVIRTLKPSGRGELEITDVNNFYIREGTITYEVLQGWWGDGGESVDTLLEASLLAAKRNGAKAAEGDMHAFSDKRIRQFIGEKGKTLIMEDGKPPLVIMPLAEYEKLTQEQYISNGGVIDDYMARIRTISEEIERINEDITRAQIVDLREEVIAEEISLPGSTTGGEITVEPLSDLSSRTP